MRKTARNPPSPPSGPFDARAEAAKLKDQTKARRRRVRRRSRLDRHGHELLALNDAGATTEELRRWLLERRIRVHHSTVARWLRRNGAG
ncbi:MAG: hypothetical protein OXK76_20285 [Gammaproteobacteria bacterium]|nr:hypothetical protein [Gammaproteobacteria bacterium]